MSRLTSASRVPCRPLHACRVFTRPRPEADVRSVAFPASSARIARTEPTRARRFKPARNAARPAAEFVGAFNRLHSAEEALDVSDRFSEEDLASVPHVEVRLKTGPLGVSGDLVIAFTASHPGKAERTWRSIRRSAYAGQAILQTRGAYALARK